MLSENYANTVCLLLATFVSTLRDYLEWGFHELYGFILKK